MTKQFCINRLCLPLCGSSVPCFHNDTFVPICHSITSDRCRSEILFTSKFVWDFYHRKFGIAGLFLKFQFINVDHGRCLKVNLFIWQLSATLHNSSSLSVCRSDCQFKQLDLFINIVCLSYDSGTCKIFWSRPLRYCLHLSDFSLQDHLLYWLLSYCLCRFKDRWWYNF